MRKVFKCFAVLFTIIFSGIPAACAPGNNDNTDDSTDDGNKKVAVASCDLIGAGGYGAMFDISIDPFDDNIFAARCDMGGLYMSYNKGKTWERHNILGVMSDIDFDEENEGVVYATGSGLYKSTDHGKTFDLLFPSEESIITHSSGGEEMHESIFTDNKDYSPSSALSSIAIDRKSKGKKIFVAQKTSNEKVRIFKTDNGKDFHTFIDHESIANYIKLEYDEANDCLIVVTDKSVTEYDQSGNVAWSASYNFTTFVGGVFSFDSYYNRKNGKNTFAFCVYNDPEQKKTTCYFTQDLRSEASYQDIARLLNGKKLKDITDDIKEHEQDYASYEYTGWNNVKQSMEWRIVNAYVASEDCIYFYNSYDDTLLDENGNDQGPVNINSYLRYKNGDFKWIYGYPHADVVELTNLSWQDRDSGSPAFGMAASRQNADRFAFSTMGTVYYTEDGNSVSQCHCTVGEKVLLTAKDGKGNEIPITDQVDRRVELRETTTNGLNVQTTYKTVTDPFDSNHLLMACTDIGVIQSFNNGKTWVRSLLSWEDGNVKSMSDYYRNTCYDIEFDKEQQGVVYAIWSGTHDAPYYPTGDYLRATGAFAISYDGGISWTMHHIRENDNVLPYRMDVEYKGNGRDIYIATEGHGFFVTHDLGESFIEMNDGIPKSNYINGQPAIFANEILVCEGGIYAICGASAWAMIPDLETPNDPDDWRFERALYKWNETLKTFEEIALPPNVACVRDIEYSEKEDCLYIGAIGMNWATNEKSGGGVYRYKDGVLTQIFDDTIYVWGLGLDSKGTLYAVSYRGEVYRFTENNSKAELLVGKEGFVGEMFHVLKDISFGATDDILYVSTFGGGMYRITLEEV